MPYTREFRRRRDRKKEFREHLENEDQKLSFDYWEIKKKKKKKKLEKKG